MEACYEKLLCSVENNKLEQVIEEDVDTKSEPSSHKLDFNLETTVKPSAEFLLQKVQSFCTSCREDGLEGVCMFADKCFLQGGQVGGSCNNQLVCCTFVNSCGDAATESVSYFQSPNYPRQSSGSVACDYDVFVQENTCAIRIDFESVMLAGKLGGVCDIDQLFVLNSVDGPTSGLCGQLSGYSTIVAVQPSQIKPLKVALLIQNELFYHWFIKLRQLPCEDLTKFKGQAFCGRVFGDPNYIGDNFIPESTNQIWWDHPEPAINTYYYASTKRHMQLAFENKLQRISERRIINGAETRPGEFPWAVAIGLDGMFFCGGAVISSLFVISAAHCLLTKDSPVESLAVHLGDYDLTSDNETQHEIRGVKYVMFHSHFHPFLLANDIALLQLSSPIQFSVFIQPICLPQPGEELSWKDATVVGWGFTSVPVGKPSPRLRQLQVQTISNSKCAILIEEPVSPGMICATAEHLQGTCFGDSGGPLTVAGNDGVHRIIGVVSFGISGCAMLPSIPDLYTRVSEYMSWITINTLL